MQDFYGITPAGYGANFFEEIGTRWGLLTAGSPGAFNSMTVSWGQAGILWGQPVCTVYVRPSRHTFLFAEKNNRLSLCFLGEEYREVMKMYGTKSGRDTDKTALGGLTPLHEDGYTFYREADTVLLLSKLYADDLRPECFVNGVPKACYPQGNDLHRVYVCKIEKILKNGKESRTKPEKP